MHRFFDQEAFSDITVKFGTRERKCHKMILCSKSTYFNDLCGPGKGFSESQQPCVELKDDDEEAVEAMLRWLYTFSYEERIAAKRPDDTVLSTATAEEPVIPDKADNTLDFHLNVCTVANEYLLAALEKEAITRLQAGLMSASEDAFVSFYDKIFFTDGHYSQNVLETVDASRDQRLETLLQHTAFRELMGNDTELCMEIIDRLRAGRDSTSFTTGLLEKQYIKCSHCKRELLTDRTEPATAHTCSSRSCNRTLPASAWRQCWMRPFW